MGDIVFDDIAHKQRRQIDTYDRIDQIEPVGTCAVERTGKQQHDLVDDPMEDESSHCRKEANNQSENDHEHLLADMLHPPLVQPLEPYWPSIVYCSFHLLFPYHSNFSVFFEFDDARRSMGFMLLTTTPAHIVHRLDDPRVDVTVILCCRLSADIR